MLFIFSAPVLIRHLWQLKTVVFLHYCLICAVLLRCKNVILEQVPLNKQCLSQKISFKHANITTSYIAETDGIYRSHYNVSCNSKLMFYP